MNGDEPRQMLGAERAALIDALTAAYPSASALDELVKTAFNPVPGTDLSIRSLGQISGDRNNLIQHAAALVDYFAGPLEMVDVLVREARRLAPFNQRLRRVHDAYFGSIQRQVPAALERKVREHSRYVDPAAWREDLERAERRVCLIASDTSQGTGFLVADDVIITNYHVMADVIDGRCDPGSVTVQFDFKRIPLKGLSAGSTFGLHGDWCLAKSPTSPVDSVIGERDREPTVEELDFALMRLNGAPGQEDVGGRARGAFKLPLSLPPLGDGSGVMILQYPADRPLQLAPPQPFLLMNANATRMRYETLTDPGSSGAPCFDTDLRLIALHHSVDPDFQRRARYNEGIPVHTIAAALPPALRTRVT